MPAGADDRLKVSRFIHLHCSPADWPDRASSCHEFPNQAKAGRSRTPVESRSPRVLAVSLCVWPLGQFPRRHDPFSVCSVLFCLKLNRYFPSAPKLSRQGPDGSFFRLSR